MKNFAGILIGYFIFDAITAAPTISSVTYVPETHEVAFEDLDNLHDHDEELYIDQAQAEIGAALPSIIQAIYLSSPLPEKHEEEASTFKLIDGSSPHEPEVSKSHYAVPTCFLCTCLGTSIYCDDRELEIIPPLLKQTAHFYARYNRIKKIRRNVFAHLGNLKKIDLTSNFISEVDEDAFRNLLQLQELILRDNKISQLTELPATLTFIDISNNRLGSKGIKPEAFKDMTDLHHLYITSNNLDHIPVPLPESLQSLHLQNNNILEMYEDTFCNINDHTYIRKHLEDIRLDGNPINLSKTPYAYTCLPRLPVGSYS